MSGTRIDRRLLILLYILAFILFREWLIPIIELTDSNYLTLFLLFVVLAFLLAFVRVKWWIVAPAKVLYIIWATHYIFLGKILFSIESVVFLMKNILSNSSIIASGDWESITNPLRTILFFSLLWMTCYLIRHWIEVRKSILLFYIMTVVFIAFIDTFGPYSADGAIFRIMITGLLLLGLLAISRLAEKHNTPISIGAFVSISVPLLFAVVVSGAFANFLPKQEPNWPDPLPYFKSIVSGPGEGGGTSFSTSGYDPDDSTLGGSFVQDDTLVIEAKVASKQYWKIETKNTYTSKGWEQVSKDDAELTYTSGMEMGESENGGQVANKPLLRAELQVLEEFPFIVYPYGMSKVYASSNVVFQHSELAGKYSTLIDGSEGFLDSYEIEFEEPDYSLKELKSKTMEDLTALTEDFAPYLQLPDQLPERVKELAETITANYEGVYEKTKAIERYFGRNGFVYTQQGVAIPKSGDDYVDQFLFETKKGYCDNFSTSMVVMLRAIDIPARWVKGFAPGEFVINDVGERVYQVTNNEAHSWVEAYMPGIGWIPYEPTIGFSNLTDIEYDIEMDRNDPEAPVIKEPEKPKKEQIEKPVKAEKNFELSAIFKSIGSWIGINKWVIITVGLIMALIAWQLFVSRVKWLPKILIHIHKSERDDWVTFTKRYKSLLKQLDRSGLKREAGMTLSDYATNIDNYFDGERMKILTIAYEKGLYGGNTTDHEWAILQEIWEDLINRTSG
jgi:hypothetical protein